MSWVYVQSEPRLWTVGFYDPSGAWHSDSDHGSPQEAGDRCAYLNGDCIPDKVAAIEQRLSELESARDRESRLRDGSVIDHD